jgi:hypothetical protein
MISTLFDPATSCRIPESQAHARDLHDRSKVPTAGGSWSYQGPPVRRRLSTWSTYPLSGTPRGGTPAVLFIRQIIDDATYL